MRAMWIFGDDLERGLEHGRHYYIRKDELKNGKVRVTIEETHQKINFKDNFDFARHFQVK